MLWNLNQRLCDFLNATAFGSDPSCSIAELYGTEKFAQFLYSVCLIDRPQNVVELGAGIGSLSMIIAAAMKQNGSGRLVLVDNGRDWPNLRSVAQHFFEESFENFSYGDFIQYLSAHFGHSDIVSILEDDVEKSYSRLPESIDLVFCDAVAADPINTSKMLANLLPRMSESSSIFIDRAATENHTWLYLEHLVRCLNMNKVPKLLKSHMSAEAFEAYKTNLIEMAYTLIPVVECDDSKANPLQNGRAWLRIAPMDFIHHNGVLNVL